MESGPQACLSEFVCKKIGSSELTGGWADENYKVRCRSNTVSDRAQIMGCQMTERPKALL